MKEAKRYLYILVFALCGVVLFISLLLIMGDQKAHARRLQQQKILVGHLLITDFCFSTESRHTRHISAPEPIAPFQDLPGFHDHFPSSSFFLPPNY